MEKFGIRDHSHVPCVCGDDVEADSEVVSVRLDQGHDGVEVLEGGPRQHFEPF
jgi:predicted dinucleotide-binding enzyme